MKTDRENREKLIELINEANCKWHNEFASGGIVKFISDYLISKGVTIPVRCVECEKERECKNAQYLGETGFCSYGERKEE